MPRQTLVIDDVTKKYRGVTAVEHITLGVEPGEIMGLIGPSGAGKTTLMRLVSGLIMPNGGDILINGVSMYRDYERCMGYMGIVHDRPEFYPNMTGRENLRCFAALHGRNAVNAVDDVIAMTGLDDYADRLPAEYPSGQKKLLALAAAMLHSPNLLVMDEILSGVDPLGAVGIRRLLHTLSLEHGLTVLMTSHNMTEIERMCDRVAVMEDGRLIGVGSVEKLKQANCSKTRHRFRVDRHEEAAMHLNESLGVGVEVRDDCIIVEAEQGLIPKIASMLQARGMYVYEISPLELTLEEAYYRMLRTKPQMQRRENDLSPYEGGRA